MLEVAVLPKHVASHVVQGLLGRLSLLVLGDPRAGCARLQEGQDRESEVEDGAKADATAGLRQEGHIVGLAVVVDVLQSRQGMQKGGTPARSFVAEAPHSCEC